MFPPKNFEVPAVSKGSPSVPVSTSDVVVQAPTATDERQNMDARYQSNDHDTFEVPATFSISHRRLRPWHYSLCYCCGDTDSCVESCCCLWCQLSRQCNMLVDNRREIHWPYCLLLAFFDYCTVCSVVSCVFASQTRRMARQRYGITGSHCSDCCAGYWCRCCSTQQVLLEMTAVNEFPGAACYNAVPSTVTCEMV